MDNIANNIPKPAPNEWIFHCKHCPKTFTSSKALGGHQNAHRTRRNSTKRKATQADESMLQHQNLTRPSYVDQYQMQIAQQVMWAGPGYEASVGQIYYYGGSCGPKNHGPGVVGPGPSIANGSKAETKTLDLTLKL